MNDYPARLDLRNLESVLRYPPCKPGGDNWYSIRVSPGRQGPASPPCSGGSPGRYWGVLRSETEPQFVPQEEVTRMRSSHSSPRGIGRRGFLGTAGTIAVTE